MYVKQGVLKQGPQLKPSIKENRVKLSGVIIGRVKMPCTSKYRTLYLMIMFCLYGHNQR